MKRFWSKVDKSGDCWEWTGGKNRKGYGNIRVNGKTVSAHRLSYFLSNGDIPDGLFVCHTCDNPGCVNPKHLWTGTVSDNAKDMYRKGRGPDFVGEKNPRAKLNPDDIKWIRAIGGSHAAVARCFGVTDVLIGLIRRRQIWTHVK